MPKKDKVVDKVNVIARAPFQVYYEGEADSLSAANRIGKFDILPGHADFFSVLHPGDIIIQNGDAEPTIFPIVNGIITVRDNEIRLFVNM